MVLNAKALLHGIVLLTLLQLGTAFTEAGYAFGLLATDVPPAIAAVAVAFVAPLALLPWATVPRSVQLGAGLLMWGARLFEPFTSHLTRVLVAGTGVAAGLVLLTTLLPRIGRNAAGQGFALASLGWAALRAVGGGADASRVGIGLPVALALAAYGAHGLWKLEGVRHEAAELSFARVLAFTAGAMLTFALALLGVTLPDDVARWTATPGVGAASVFAVAMLVWLALGRWRPAWQQPSPRIVALCVGCLGVVVALALHGTSVTFPTAADGYPLVPEASITRFAAWPMLVMLPVLAMAHGTFVGVLANCRLRPVAGAVTLAAVGVLVLIALQIFTTIYDYVPVVGPWLRDRFWLVHAVPVALVALLALTVSPPAATEPTPRASFIAGGLLTITVIGAYALRTPKPVAPARTDFRVLTYNVQQGFNIHGTKGLENQLGEMLASGADIIGLQECDSTRLAGGHDDLVRYFAERLGMHSYYGPPSTVGTFGVALLSRYPIASARTVYMHSVGEQTATIVAEIDVAGRPLVVAVTHLGNDGALEQLEDLLVEVETRRPLVLMGDFNFTRSSPQFMRATRHLADAFGAAHGSPDPAAIDHIFTAGANVTSATYSSPFASDHPAVSAALTMANAVGGDIL